MKWLERAVEAVHAGVLGVWLAVLVGAGMAAGVAFPEMKALEPKLPDYGGYAGEHWVIAAGHIGRRVFSITDRAQLVTAALAVATLAVVTRFRIATGWMVAVRWAGVAVAASLAVYNGLSLAPRMDEHLVTYWDAARAGDERKAAEHQAAFRAEHPRATRVLVISACGVFLGLIAAAASRDAAAARST